MHFLPRRPGKPEQPDWQAEAAHHRCVESVFWSYNAEPSLFVAFVMFFAESQTVNDDYGDGAENDTETDAEECETGETGGEVVDALEDKREGVEEAEEDGEIIASVEAEGKHNRFCNNHTNRSR